MAKKKYYAVRIGKVPGIYETWNDCTAQVNGVSGAEYKSFSTIEEATAYIQNDSVIEKISDTVDVTDINSDIQERINSLNEDEVVAFVDGSYDDHIKKSGFGVIIIDNKLIETQLYKAFSENIDSEFLSHRNISAEIEGVKEAILWALSYNKKQIYIYYDYEGIEKWANGSWKANNPTTKKYLSFIEEKKQDIKLVFNKVPAHSGVEYNEKVDSLAKKSLLEKGYKTYNDGTVYFTGFSVDDWKTIVELLNNENSSLDEKSSNIVFSSVKGDKKEHIVIKEGSSKVSINCYSNGGSYVQGRQTPLFQRTISMAIGLLGTDDSVIETLNRYHVLNLKPTEVEMRFHDFLPDYSGDIEGKFYKNLLSAVYNTLLVGYMPDYTCLLLPVFRAFEYCLHRILGDFLGKDTSDDKGKNHFAFFSKNGVRYECNLSNINTLSDNQLKCLNDIYNEYNYVRHQYSHWSADDCDVAVIESMSVAQEHLKEGLELVNKYFKYF